VVGAAIRERGREEEKRGRERVGMPVGCTRTVERERIDGATKMGQVRGGRGARVG